MRNRIGVAALGVIVALAPACGGSDGAQGPAGPPGSSGANGGDGGPAPAHAPAGVSFEDDDYAQGAIRGSVTVHKASDESDVTSYAVYWGSNTTDKIDLAPIFEAKTTGQDISFPYEGLVPTGATTLLAFAKNPNGESATPVATTSSIDHYFMQVDVSGGVPSSSVGAYPSIALDTKNQKVVISSSDANQKLALHICNYDGTGCATKDGSAGQPNGSLIFSTIAVDDANGKIRVAAANAAFHIAYYVCNLDGTGCTYTDLSATVAQVPQTSGRVAMAIDAATNQLWIAVRNEALSSELGILHCALDATGCAFHGYVGNGANSGQNPSIAVDVPGNHLYVGGTDGSNGNNYDFIVACAADGTACVNDSFNPDVEKKCLAPSVAIDPSSKRLFYASKSATDSDSLTVWDTTITTFDGFVTEELSQGDTDEVTNESQTTSVAFDPIHKRVLVAAADTETGFLGTLYRCNADGTGCKAENLSVGLPSVSGVNPQIALDPTTGQFFVTMENRLGHREDVGLPMLVFLK